jgi:glycine cleavage system aminomethyltransferase T/glycine/D-amino acid oxidase-like deaminating enzyme
MDGLKGNADVVIIGGGIAGCSVAYHLARKGVKDIVLLEQDKWPEPGGSTSHASDFIFPLDPSRVTTWISRYSAEFYDELRFNGNPCFQTVGGIEVARTTERMGELKRKISSGKSWGVEAELVTPQEARELLPFLNEEQILGAMWSPTAGLVTRSVDAAQIMVQYAREMGALQVFDHTPVTGIDVQNGCVRGVHTSRGYIRTDNVVSAVGIWGPLIGRMAGVPIPLAPLHHQLVYTGPVPELHGARAQIEWPLLRDQDRAMYVRQEHNTWEIGSYQHRSLITPPEELAHPDDAKYTPTMLPFTPQDFEKPMADICEVVPVLENAPFHFGFNGLISVTVDGPPILGEAPNVRGFWACEALWIKEAPGAAHLLAQWMVDGATEIDVSPMELARFYPHQTSQTHVKARTSEGFQKVYGIVHPREQWESSRGIRRSPFFPRQVELGAKFFETAGWERPQWYDANQKLLEDYPAPQREGWEAMWWSPVTGAEHQALREQVGLIDLTSFVKLEVRGPGALAFLQFMSAAQVDRPVGSVIYTPLLTNEATIKSDLTITRLAEDRFLVVTGAGMGMQDLTWLRRHAPQDGSVELIDRTVEMCVLGVWGPRARDLMQSVTGEDLSAAAFPFATGRTLFVGPVQVLALRISYIGELGWEVYAPMDQGLKLWDILWEAGQPLGIIAAGLSNYLSSMRLEKANLLLGHDIHTEYNPYEADLARPKIKSDSFMGREALLKIRERGVSRKICTLTVDSGQVVMSNETAIFNGDSRWLGYVHSADYGYSVGQSLALGYLPLEYAREGQKVQLKYRGERHPATVAAVGTRPLFDPDNHRMKC